MSSINNNPPKLPPVHLPAELAETVAKTPGGTRPLGKVEPEHVEHFVEVPPKKMSAADAERMRSQSGFSRVGKRRARNGMEIDDNASQSPIPLPAEDVDEGSWDQRTLDDAQEELTLQSAQLAHFATEMGVSEVDAQGLIQKLAGQVFSPTEADVQRLQSLQDAEPLPQVAMGEVNSSIDKLFGIKIDQVDSGAALVAASLVVAGLSEDVTPEGKSLRAGGMARGIHKVVQSGQKAVQDGRSMSSDVSEQLRIQQTFVFRR